VSDMRIRTFTEQDIDFALVQTGREGWDNTAAAFRVYLAHDPGGCFIAEIDGRRAAMITTTRYAQSAWVGNLIVTPEHRRRGLGERMMKHALAKLEESGVRAIYLEADPMGIGIYRRLGFVDHFVTPRFKKTSPHDAKPREAERLDADGLDAVLELDARCFGEDRGALLREFLGIASAAYCLRAGARVEAYAMALPALRGVRFGPCAAENPRAIELLVDAVLTDFPDKTVIAAVPEICRAAIQAFESRGFTHEEGCRRMIRGAAARAPSPEGIVALADGATG